MWRIAEPHCGQCRGLVPVEPRRISRRKVASSTCAIESRVETWPGPSSAPEHRAHALPASPSRKRWSVGASPPHCGQTSWLGSGAPARVTVRMPGGCRFRAIVPFDRRICRRR
jgi:hypothetical protein